MRREDSDSGQRLTPSSAFSMDRLNKNDNFETGLSSTIGFDYKNNRKKENLIFL